MNQMAYDLVNNSASNSDIFILPDQCKPVLQCSLVSFVTSYLDMSFEKHFSEWPSIPVVHSKCFFFLNVDALLCRNPEVRLPCMGLCSARVTCRNSVLRVHSRRTQHKVLITSLVDPAVSIVSFSCAAPRPLFCFSPFGVRCSCRNLLCEE